MTGSGEILSGGFGLLAKRPAAIAIWAAIYAALGLASVLLVLPAMMHAMQNQVSAMNNPQAGVAMMQSMGAVQGLSWLLSLAGSFLGAILLCGAFRIALRPEEPGFAGLRVGMDEVRVFAMIMVITFGGVIIGMIVMLLAMLLSLLFWFAASNMPVLAGLLIAAVWIVTICAFIYALVRISLIFPLTFIRREFAIDEAWKLSRGRFWTLFVPYLVIGLIIMLASCLVALPMLWSMMGELQHFPVGGDPQAVQAFTTELMAHWFGQPFGVMGAVVLIGSVVRAMATAVNGGAMATAARGFLADDGNLPEIFE